MHGAKVSRGTVCQAAPAGWSLGGEREVRFVPIEPGDQFGEVFAGERPLEPTGDLP
jgi:hypothetical protein